MKRKYVIQKDFSKFIKVVFIFCFSFFFSGGGVVVGEFIVDKTGRQQKEVVLK